MLQVAMFFQQYGKFSQSFGGCYTRLNNQLDLVRFKFICMDHPSYNSMRFKEDLTDNKKDKAQNKRFRFTNGMAVLDT